MAMLDVYRVEVFGQALRWFGPDGRLIDERPLDGVDGLVAEVGKALGDPMRRPDLRAVGQRLYRWLDGERRWLAGALGRKRGLTLQIDVDKRLGHSRNSLYSERARVGVVQTRQLIESEGISPDLNGIRGFRDRIIEDPKLAPLRRLLLGLDFFSTSTLRDLIFHV